MLATVALVLLLPQEFKDEDRFGKTVDQVLAMGRDKWHDYYTDESRGGGSTAGESFAQMIFADCLRVKNNHRFRTARDSKTAVIISLDPGFERTVSNCVTAGSALTGGGTMWNIISSSAQVERQLTLRDLIWPTKQMPSATQTQAWKEFKASWKDVTDSKEDIESYSDRGNAVYQEALNALRQVNTDLNDTIKKVELMPASFKGRVFAFFVDQLKMVRTGN